MESQSDEHKTHGITMSPQLRSSTSVILFPAQVIQIDRRSSLHDLNTLGLKNSSSVRSIWLTSEPGGSEPRGLHGLEHVLWAIVFGLM